MRRSPRIRSFPATTLDALPELEYDSMLASVGYEQRSRQIAEASAASGVAIPFGDRRVLDYPRNREFFEKREWDQPSLEGSSCFAVVSDWLNGVVDGNGRPTRVAVDISSMSRNRIADVVEAVVSLPPEVEIDIDFLYTPAKFRAPAEEDEPPVFKVAPVSSFFAGWWDALDEPLFVVVGLGYELQRAASALDVLEPAGAQIYVPVGTDKRYLEAVQVSNEGLFDVPSVHEIQVRYNVADPFECFRRLEASVARLEHGHRVALVPLGPKIFALVAVLTAAFHRTTAQVIRVSAGERQEPLPQESDGNLYGLTLALRPPSDEGE